MCKKWAYFIASVFINQLSCLITKYIFLFIKLWDTHILDCKIVQYKMSNVYCLMHYKLIINKWSIHASASLFRSHWLLIAMLIEIYLNEIYYEKYICDLYTYTYIVETNNNNYCFSVEILFREISWLFYFCF